MTERMIGKSTVLIPGVPKAILVANWSYKSDDIHDLKTPRRDLK